MTAREQLAEMAARNSSVPPQSMSFDAIAGRKVDEYRAVLRWFDELAYAKVNSEGRFRSCCNSYNRCDSCIGLAMRELLKELEIEAAPASGLQPGSGGYYWPLFEHMSHAHGLTLLDSEMEDICRAVDRVRERPKKTRKTRRREKCSVCGKMCSVSKRGYLHIHRDKSGEWCEIFYKDV